MIFGYPETLQGEGKTEMGMKPTNLHYYSNKVYPMKVTIFDHETWSTLLKDFNTLLEVCLEKGL